MLIAWKITKIGKFWNVKNLLEKSWPLNLFATILRRKIQVTLHRIYYWYFKTKVKIFTKIIIVRDKIWSNFIILPIILPFFYQLFTLYLIFGVYLVIAKKLGFKKSIPPFANGTTEILEGLNYGSGGGGILNETGSQFVNISLFHKLKEEDILKAWNFSLFFVPRVIYSVWASR